MSKRVDWGEVGSGGKKGEKKDEMRLKGRTADFKVGPRGGRSRATRNDHMRDPNLA